VGISPLERRAAVFFDRDGVLNRAIVRDGLPYPPRTIEELVLAEGCEEAVARLAAAVPLLFVVTNQPDVARGTASRDEVELLNHALASMLPITRFYTCYHDDDDRCSCRKPLPGAFLKAAEDYALDLSACFMVGDRWRDIEAGCAAGCTTVLIQKEYDEKVARCNPDFVVSSITEAVDSILANLSRRVISRA
jgi:D-glycero-D-manno-heptose 1,7-bisphosphate phosphatase